MKELTITSNEADQRIDRFLKKYLSKASKGFLYKLIRKKRIKLNNKRVSPDYMLKRGDTIQLFLSNDTINDYREIKEISKFQQDLDIVYEDENILIVNKSRGLLVHSSSRNDKATLIDQVYYYLNSKGEYIPDNENTFSPACCNRIDRNTSGIIMVAKNYPSLKAINKMLKDYTISKKYLALVEGKVSKENELKGFLIKDSKTNKVEVFSRERKHSKFIHTRYRPIKNKGNYSLIDIDLITGRSHQIRVHLASVGNPLIGDFKYGDKRINNIFLSKYKLSSQFLHGYLVHFDKCPPLLKYLEGKSFRANTPNDLQNILEDLGLGED